jgi:hypothetical protein
MGKSNGTIRCIMRSIEPGIDLEPCVRGRPRESAVPLISNSSPFVVRDSSSSVNSRTGTWNICIVMYFWFPLTNITITSCSISIQ